MPKEFEIDKIEENKKKLLSSTPTHHSRTKGVLNAGRTRDSKAFKGPSKVDPPERAETPKKWSMEEKVDVITEYLRNYKKSQQQEARRSKKTGYLEKKRRKLGKKVTVTNLLEDVSKTSKGSKGPLFSKYEPQTWNRSASNDQKGQKIQKKSKPDFRLNRSDQVFYDQKTAKNRKNRGISIRAASSGEQKPEKEAVTNFGLQKMYNVEEYQRMNSSLGLKQKRSSGASEEGFVAKRGVLFKIAKKGSEGLFEASNSRRTDGPYRGMFIDFQQGLDKYSKKPGTPNWRQKVSFLIFRTIGLFLCLGQDKFV